MNLIRQYYKNFVSLLDLRLIVRFALIIGLFMLGFGYVMNDNLLEVLKLNTGIEYSQVQGLSASNMHKVTTVSSEPFQLIKRVKLCSFLSDADTRYHSDASILALVTPSIGFTDIPKYQDIVYLRDYGIETYEFTRLRKEPAENLKQMFQAMHLEKLYPFISSGYRTNEDQVKNYTTWTGLLGVARGSKYAAKPGFSEHHLGTTVDILTPENSQGLQPTYDKTNVSKWLKNNAHKYGFVMSYPSGSETTTGYTYEPWHFRFVGKEVAREVRDNNLLLQDYLYRLNGYCLKEQKQLQFID